MNIARAFYPTIWANGPLIVLPRFEAVKYISYSLYCEPHVTIKIGHILSERLREISRRCFAPLLWNILRIKMQLNMVISLFKRFN